MTTLTTSMPGADNSLISTIAMDPASGLERMPTGIPGLDHVLEGGLIRGNSLLIEGPPGSGKSSLATRILYEGILHYKEPALLITFEEFPRQLYLDALQFGMDLQPLEKSGMLRLVWTPPARVLQGFTGKIDLIDKIVDEMGVRRSGHRQHHPLPAGGALGAELAREFSARS